MDEYIDEVKTIINRSTEKLRSVFKDVKLRFSFIGYRDYVFEDYEKGIWNDPDDRIVVLPFTNDNAEFTSFVNKIKAGGGGDCCEDVFGGLNEVLKLQWKNLSKALIHVTDAPCHGERFHNNEIDDFPKGDPQGLQISKIIKNLIANDIDYYFTEIREKKTKKMIDEFNKEMDIAGGKGIQLYKLKSAGNLLETVMTAVSHTICNTQHANMHNLSTKEMKELGLDRNRLNWKRENFEEFTANCYTFRFEGDLDSFDDMMRRIPEKRSIDRYIKSEMEKVNILLCPVPFSRGNLRYAYAAMMKNKEGKYERYAAKNSIFKDDLMDTFEGNKQAIITQNISKYLAECFIKISPSVKSIRFIDLKLLQINKTNEFFSIETFVEGNFSKWSNNIGNINEHDYTATLDTFAHWTHTATFNYLVVSDLQGFRSDKDEYVLTDPAISCVYRQFTTTDLGEDGINLYFAKHKCNHMCEALKLEQHVLQSGERRSDIDKMTKLKKPK